MESITRLPMVWPTRPLSQPGMTCSGDAPMTKPNGEPDDQEEPKTFLVRQMYPAYCATRYSPFTTFGPLPLTSVLVTRPPGGEEDGKDRAGAVPALAATVGRLPPPLDTWAPVAPAVLE